MTKRMVIVPARGGSKRLPNKNQLLLGDKPLIYYTLDVVADLFDMVILSTDSEDIYQLGVEHHSGKITPLPRPEHLATDTSKVLETVGYLYDNCEADLYDQIWLCLPTCPLRSGEDITGAQTLLTSDIDGVVSVTDFEFPPTLGLTLAKSGMLVENNPERPFATGNTRSQDHAKIYRPNGALYGAWWKSFGTNRNFFKGLVKGYYMPRNRSIDIDTELDLEIAKAIWKQNLKY